MLFYQYSLLVPFCSTAACRGFGTHHCWRLGIALAGATLWFSVKSGLQRANPDHLSLGEEDQWSGVLHLFKNSTKPSVLALYGHSFSWLGPSGRAEQINGGDVYPKQITSCTSGVCNKKIKPCVLLRKPSEILRISRNAQFSTSFVQLTVHLCWPWWQHQPCKWKGRASLRGELNL